MCSTSNVGAQAHCLLSPLLRQQEPDEVTLCTLTLHEMVAGPVIKRRDSRQPKLRVLPVWEVRVARESERLHTARTSTKLAGCKAISWSTTGSAARQSGHHETPPGASDAARTICVAPVLALSYFASSSACTNSADFSTSIVLVSTIGVDIARLCRGCGLEQGELAVESAQPRE
eukprot:CAMPEP_0179999836 /NCGR_PEP_ID=MMETSP0984-20121128/9483_1 /TAXON_ID=483367 /ORGANISM="non described non described, Strain CCMP 2436" /LENGTH=173 /DNA_ID=CAMNT_0021919725 /DNA_START=309 /DNA_END=831 /DNA_ORIENTATION=+